MKHFAEDGLAFSFPETWTIEREKNPQGWVVTLQSPGTAFVLILCDTEMPDPEDMAETTLAALKSDYPEMDAFEVDETLAGLPAIGHNVEFISLDQSNTCKIRSFPGPEGTILLMAQMCDLELEKFGSQVNALFNSLKVEGD